MKRPPVTSVVAALLLAVTVGCGSADDSVAATVDGREIESAKVRAFAATDYIAGQAAATETGMVSSPPGTTGGAKQRLALSFLVQAQVYENEVERLGETIGADDLESAEQQLTEYESTNGAELGDARPTLKRLLAAQAALVRLRAGGEPTEAAVAAYFEEHRDEFGTLTCVDGFAVTEDKVAAAQAAVDRRDPIETILANPDLAPQALSQDGAESCVEVGQITEPGLGELVDNGTVDTWASTTVANPETGANLVVFIRPNSREEPTPDSPSVAARISEALQTEAQEKFAGEVQKAMENAEVEIDPRYGTWDPSDPALVLPPSTPSQGAIPTTLPSLTSQ